MRKSQAFLLLNVAFLTGVGIATIVRLPEWAGSSLLGFGFLSIVLRRPRWWFGAAVIAVGLGVLRVDLAKSPAPPPRYVVGGVTRGVVVSEPVTRGRNHEFVVKVDGGSRRYLAVIPKITDVSYGDRVEMRCQPDPARSEGEQQRFLLDQISARCAYPGLEKIGKGFGNPLLASLYRVKDRFRNDLTRELPEPQAALGAGILLGGREDFPREVLEDFNRTGTTHIIALSGYNITILAVLIRGLLGLSSIHRRASLGLTFAAITLFILLTGASASVVRAGIMGGLVLLSRQIGRIPSSRNLLAFAGTVMVLINPHLLVFDRSFQLSFAATAGLLFVSPWLGERLRWIPNILMLRESVSTTLSATLFTLPIILLAFGRLALLGVFANLLILPVIPFAMGFSLLTGLTAMVTPSLAVLPAAGAWLLLTYMLEVVKLIAGFPFAAIELPRNSQ